jgi:hypothetical protein
LLDRPCHQPRDYIAKGAVLIRCHHPQRVGELARHSCAVNLMSSPDGRTKLWNAVKQFPSDFIEGLKLPGEVAAGTVDLSTPEGMEPLRFVW